MNITKFTQTKFKDRPPPPVPKTTKRHRKRCAPPVPDGETATSEGETSEPRSSAEYSPPPPPADLKDFLIDVAQEVVISKPVDIIDHLAEYTTNLQMQLRQREEEENAIRILMEEKAQRLQIEDHASRVIQMAFRGFKMRKQKQKSKMLFNCLAPGVTLQQANRAAACIQRNYRRHTINKRVKLKLQRDAADGEVISPYCPRKKQQSESLIRMLKQIDEPVGQPESVTELYGPKTPFNANGEKFGVDPPCHMAAPLLASERMSLVAEVASENVPSDQSITKVKVEEEVIVGEKKISGGSVEKVKADETGDAVVPGSENLEGQEDAAMPALSSETKENQDDAETAPPPPSPERSSGSVTKVPSGEEKNEETVDVPEATQDAPPEAPPEVTEEKQGGEEEETQDAPLEEPVKEPSATEEPTVDNGAQ